LTAIDGDISQGFTNGMVNIGYTPESVLSSLETVNKAATSTYKAPSYATHDVRTEGANNVDAYLNNVETGGRIAGGSVYLAASAINVNGLIQSGYGNYSAEITQEQVNAAIVRSVMNKTGGTLVNGRQLYKVNQGGLKKGENGIYGYVVQVYYDPSTKGLVVEDIDTTGGKVYLSGRILSTGKGRIYAIDGGADISIKNQSNVAMSMGKVQNNNIDGVIEITDTLKNTRTTYTRNSTTTLDLNDYQAWMEADDAGKAKLVKVDKASNTYKPKDYVRYNWTDGTQTTTKTTFFTDKTKFLSILKTDETTISSEEKTAQQSKISYKGEPLPQGSFVSEGKKGDAAYILTADNQLMTQSRSGVSSWTEWHFLNKHYYSRWTRTDGTAQTYANSLIADKPIEIGFLGKTDGSITLSSVKDLTFSSNVRNNSAGAKLSANVTDGAITQQAGTTIFGNHADLQAKGAVKDITISAIDDKTPVKLNVISWQGVVTADVEGAAQIKNLAAGAGNILTATSYGDKNIVLTATGDITQSQESGAFGVKGLHIDIESGGTVGETLYPEDKAYGDPLKVMVGQEAVGSDPLSASINIKAAGDINLIQPAGDMRIGKIVSEGGDVSLEATAGTFIDALPYAGTKSNADTDALVQRWMDLGLIEGDGENAYTRQLAQNVEDYKGGVEKDYSEYQKLKSYFDSEKKYNELDAYFKEHPEAPSDTSSAAYKEYVEKSNTYAELKSAYWLDKADIDNYSEARYNTLKAFFEANPTMPDSQAQPDAYNQYVTNMADYSRLSAARGYLERQK
ncbi:MAG: hypothetical protein J5492_03705, partial [Oxalobacter sp.]|nr:hypothetical protein [Oxalobacter sp.]